MAKMDVCPPRIYITLDDISRETLIFQCARTGMSKSAFINQLIHSTVDRDYVLTGARKEEK